MPRLSCERCLNEKDESFTFALWVPVLNSQQSQCAYHLDKDPDSTQREGTMAITRGSRVHACSLPSGHTRKASAALTAAQHWSPLGWRCSRPLSSPLASNCTIPFPLWVQVTFKLSCAFSTPCDTIFLWKYNLLRGNWLPENWSLFLVHPTNTTFYWDFWFSY